MKNKPTPEKILKAKVKYHSDNFALTGLNHLPYVLYPVVIEVMQEYAELYHKEKLRGELIKFAKDNQGCFIVSPTLCVDEYLKTKE